ncbi:MAG: bifunctional adenosylcobinamide kinase/adenosylcobinamide-phosphate guanylyltransferase [Alphaproteobacteria bacterium]
MTLVLGGARSGKSAYAESLVTAHGGAPLYLATAEAGDGEMERRIALHQERRGPAWRTIEAPVDLGAALGRVPEGAPVLVDCLTLWLSNLMLAGREIDAEVDGLCAALANPSGPVVLVANEVGFGIVPDNALARAFRDHAGRLNQRVAALADRVVLVVAGLPLVVKSPTETP